MEFAVAAALGMFLLVAGQRFVAALQVRTRERAQRTEFWVANGGHECDVDSGGCDGGD